MKPILEIQNISKKFRIGGDRSGYKTLRDSLFSGRGRKEDKGEFWALQDVSFDVFPGDSIGIIGKNGAGKSTLLKILSRITPPTKGKIVCRGRVASLLEVGTGFHGELSGRENIYLNGSILGLKRTEINNKFDEIVDFSGVEKFLDTPLKHYSSGMQLRLAFAVAAHLEPEILIIDEVLAVGDAEFQKKCLGKMDEISKQQGRTILFVSHNMDAVLSLCKKGVCIDHGKILKINEINDVVNVYHSIIKINRSMVFYDNPDQRPGDECVKLNSVKLVDENKSETDIVQINKKFGIAVSYEVIKDGFEPSLNLHFYAGIGNCAFVAIAKPQEINYKVGNHNIILWIPGDFLNAEKYTVGVALTTLKNVNVHLNVQDAISFDVVENVHLREHEYFGKIPGLIRPELEFEILKNIIE